MATHYSSHSLFSIQSIIATYLPRPEGRGIERLDPVDESSTAMNSRRRPSPTIRQAQPFKSTQSSFRTRQTLLNVVPTGTVASRVSFIENNPNSAYRSHRPSAPYQVRLQSRTGFGRRMTRRFGRPASCNEYPNEEPQVDIEHGFLGLSYTGIEHVYERGLTDEIDDRRGTYSGSSGIHGQRQAQGLPERGTYDAASPWSMVPKQHNSTYWRNEMGVFEQGDGSGIESYFTGRTSIFETPAPGTGHAHIYSRRTKSRHDNTMRSDSSDLTTSTVRRQSVRDLFDHYGIERPHGLISGQAMPHEDISQQVKPKIHCQNCSGYNHESSDWCTKCRMVLRRIKPMQSRSLISPKGQSSLSRSAMEEEPSSPDSSAKENQATEKPKKQRAKLRPGHGLLQSPKDAPYKQRKLSTPPTKFASFDMTQSPSKSQMIPRKVTLQEPESMPRLLKGSQTTTIVKESPFFVADRLLSAKSSQYLSISPQGDGHCPAMLSREQPYLNGEPIANDVGCDSPGCRATHQSHQPYRHSIACSRLKQRVPEEMDKGYVADVSFAEDLRDPASFLPYEAKHVSRQQSSQSLLLKGQETSNQSFGSGYVECRGYPRTGHARHGSATSCALGQCQHCIDDCQCSACQNTHHSVRCCMNENHQGMVHHHHSTRVVSSTVNLLGCPTFSSQSVEPPEKLPAASLARISGTVLPLEPQRKEAAQLSSSISRTSVNVQPPSTDPKSGKAQRLPISDRYTVLQGTSKPQTPPPPPWASDIRAKTPSSTQLSKPQVIRTTADAIFNVQDNQDPHLTLKERPTLPPPPAYDLSSPEPDRGSTVRTSVSTMSDHEQEEDKSSHVSSSCCLSGSEETQPRSPSIHSASGASRLSTSESSKPLRGFSEFLRNGEKNTVPLVIPKLLEHQDDLRMVEEQCISRIEFPARDSGNSDQSLPPKATWRVDKKKGVDQEKSFTSSKASGTTKKRRILGFSLEDKKPPPPCHNDGPVKEHLLSEDATIDEEKNSVLPKKSMVFENETEEHDCVWRARFVASQNDSRSQRAGDQEHAGQALKGVTVVVHMEGKDDLVIETDLRKGV